MCHVYNWYPCIILFEFPGPKPFQGTLWAELWGLASLGDDKTPQFLACQKQAAHRHHGMSWGSTCGWWTPAPLYFTMCCLSMDESWKAFLFKAVLGIRTYMAWCKSAMVLIVISVASYKPLLKFSDSFFPCFSLCLTHIASPCSHVKCRLPYKETVFQSSPLHLLREEWNMAKCCHKTTGSTSWSLSRNFVYPDISSIKIFRMDPLQALVAKWIHRVLEILKPHVIPEGLPNPYYWMSFWFYPHNLWSKLTPYTIILIAGLHAFPPNSDPIGSPTLAVALVVSKRSLSSNDCGTIGVC